ncbi:PREDICTED: transcription factor HES-7 [Gekko japonicus]|uniref:Transcription factor HES-7 n=1 Tax=Gekko japonicus TaxID=146911 RepID=A0ABM1KZ44_GEKJA|nr:PREDICTED: transcription factor HES-7 [Gekko japonicus]
MSHTHLNLSSDTNPPQPLGGGLRQVPGSAKARGLPARQEIAGRCQLGTSEEADQRAGEAREALGARACGRLSQGRKLGEEEEESQGTPPMLKPLVEKRRRDRINRSLEELRLLLLQRTHRQTLKNPKVEKAEILEIAVGYLREMNSAKPQGTADQRGADLPEDRTLQACYMMGFRECLLGLAAFIQQAHPSVQSHLLDTLHLYLASKPEPRGHDWSCGPLSPNSSLGETPPRTPEAFCSPVKQTDEPLRSTDPPCSSGGRLGSQQRHTHPGAASPKRLPPPQAYWRPWP